jgi:peroxidase
VNFWYVLFVKTGGQDFQMTTGRLDGTVSDMQTANNDLVSTKSSATELTQKFMALGLGQDEMITLSGTNLYPFCFCRMDQFLQLN